MVHTSQGPALNIVDIVQIICSKTHLSFLEEIILGDFPYRVQVRTSVLFSHTYLFSSKELSAELKIP